MRRLVWIFAIAACSKSSDPAASQPAPAPAPTHHEDRHEPAVAAPALKLDVNVDGTATTWQQDVFDRVPHFESKNNDGDARDTWSLRELVHTAAGANARVVAVIGETKQAIDAAAWADPSHTPIVHRTRRGSLKFRWADKDGKWGETEVKDVVGLELSAH